MYVGVDGCSAGWIAVCYDDQRYAGTHLYKDVEDLWDNHSSARSILIDVPIGLRESSNAKRPSDDEARTKLGQPGGSSVFPVPVRDAIHADSYEEAKKIQECRTGGSLGTQSWSIADKIGEVDTFLRETEPGTTDVIREAHPEVCFWALNGRSETKHSKKRQPAAAFWERVTILERVETQVLTYLREGGSDLDAEVGNDDLIDAFSLALTASERTAPVQTLPEEWPDGDQGDPTGLPMEMIFAEQSA